MSNVTSTIETEPTLNPSHRIRRHLPVWLAVVAVIVLAVNLRPGATSIGPLLSELRAGLHMGPGVAALLCVAFGAMTLLTLLPAVGEYVTQIQAFLATLALDAVYGQTMLRAMGIVLITQFAAQVCRDMDAPSIACRAELCGRLLLLGVSLPIFLKLTQMAVGALQ